jgi:hypothetical protein
LCRFDAFGTAVENALRVTTGSRFAIGLAALLVAMAALTGWQAATTVRSNAATLTNPGRAYAWVVTAGIFAACFCIPALWYLRRVWEGRRGWRAVMVSYPLAVIALYGVLVVAGLTGLGG